MKDKPLTVKQKKFVKAYVENEGNGLQAAKKVYKTSSDKSAAVISSQNLAKLNIKDAIDQSLIKHGIDIDLAVAPIAKALVATKVVIHGNKEDAFAEEVEDIELQLKGSDRALKLMGVSQEKTPAVNIVFNSQQARKYIDAD